MLRFHESTSTKYVRVRHDITLVTSLFLFVQISRFMTTYFRYYDPRYGDTYEIYLDHDGTFSSACRSVEAIGRDPIYYDSLSEIPPFHRNAIEHLILQRSKDNGNP